MTVAIEHVVRNVRGLGRGGACLGASRTGTGNLRVARPDSGASKLPLRTLRTLQTLPTLPAESRCKSRPRGAMRERRRALRAMLRQVSACPRFPSTIIN
jgi:hypothetical protein